MFLAISYARERKLTVALLLCLAEIGRESTVLLLPGFVLLWCWGYSPWREPLRAVKDCWVLVIPAAFHVGWMLLLPHPDMATASGPGVGAPPRYEHFRVNFASREATVETILSLVLVLGVPVVLAWHARRHEATALAPAVDLLRASVLTLAINTPIVLVATKAREARLFALPLLFIWPAAGPWVGSWIGRWRVAWMQDRRRTLGVVVIAAVGVILLRILLDFAYAPTLGGGFYDGYRMQPWPLPPSWQPAP